MLDDPIRNQRIALGVGAVLAAIVLVICVVLALLRPHGSLGTEPIIMVRESGAVYVRIGDTLHPALNLASARLVAGTPAVPRMVGAEMIAHAERGPLVGIAGAPGIIAAAVEADRPAWTVCDDADGTTTMTIGAPTELPVAPPILVTAAQERVPGVYLLHGGRRAALDIRDRAAIRALRLDNVVPQHVSAVLLDALPEATAIAAVRIPGAGGPGALQGLRVGEVVRVQRADGAEHYVVLADGVQRIGRVAADLIRYSGVHDVGPVPDIPAARLAAVPVVQTVALTDLTETAVRGAESVGALCARWQWPPDGQAPVTDVLLPAAALPGQSSRLVQADGAGPRIDAVALPEGHSLYVRAVGAAGDGGAAGPRYLVTDAGVAFGIAAADDAAALGLPPTPGSAPWPLLALLPRGPELSAARAAVLRDTVGAPS